MEGPADVTPTADAIREWIAVRIGHLTNVPPAEVDVRVPLTRHGLDSVALIVLAAELEQWLGYRFRENPLDATSTIESFAQFLAAQVAKNPPG